MVLELILTVSTVLAELVEAGVGVADLGLRLDQSVAAFQGGTIPELHVELGREFRLPAVLQPVRRLVQQGADQLAIAAVALAAEADAVWVGL